MIEAIVSGLAFGVSFAATLHFLGYEIVKRRDPPTERNTDA